MNAQARMGSRERVERVSKRLAGLCVLLMIVAPVSVALYWTVADSTAMGWRWLGGITEPLELTPTVRWLGFAATLLPLTPVIAGLLSLWRLFRLYGSGTMFGAANVAALKGFGLSCVFFGVAETLFHPLVSLSLTAFNPAGQHVITVGVDSDTVVVLLVGCVFLVITWVMDEARKIDEELALTV